MGSRMKARGTAVVTRHPSLQSGIARQSATAECERTAKGLAEAAAVLDRLALKTGNERAVLLGAVYRALACDFDELVAIGPPPLVAVEAVKRRLGAAQRELDRLAQELGVNC